MHWDIDVPRLPSADYSNKFADYITIINLVIYNKWSVCMLDISSHLLPFFDKIFPADMSHNSCGQGITHHIDHGPESIPKP